MQFRAHTRTTLTALLLVAVTLVAYAPVLDAGFVNIDDQLYLTENPRTQQGLSSENIGWVFRPDSIVAGNWHPLTLLSHMLDVEVFGMNPAGHHATNLGLHLLCVIGLFLVLLRATGAFWRSFLVAALFALHPVNVESVAWVSERKNVLSTLFWIGAMGAWVVCARRRTTLHVGLTTFLLLLGLLAKPMLVTLPFALLLLDFWPLRRWGTGEGQHSWRRLFAEKTPMFLLVLLFSMITLYAQSGSGAVSAMDDEPLSFRFSNAVVAYAKYVLNIAWPHELSPFYPLPSHAPPVSRVAVLLLALVVVSAGTFLQRYRRPYLFAGWFWYLGTLVPVIGVIQVGNQSMADRYLYVPAIGLFVAGVWLLASVAKRWSSTQPARILIVLACSGVALGLGWSTHAQATRWHDSETLFRYAAELPGCNYFAHNNLGSELNRQGRLKEALVELQRAVECQPGSPLSQMNLGTTLLQLDQPKQAELHLRLAVELKDDLAEAHANLGAALMKLRRFDEAVVQLRRAITLDPGLQAAQNNLKRALEWQRRTRSGG